MTKYEHYGEWSKMKSEWACNNKERNYLHYKDWIVNQTGGGFNLGGLTSASTNNVYCVTVDVPDTQTAQTQATIYPTATATSGQTISSNWYQGLLGVGASYWYQNRHPHPSSLIYNWTESIPETDATRAERIKQEAAAAEMRKTAHCRAENLLFSVLTPAQVKQYTDDAYFEVPVNDRVYRLHKRSRSGNVELIEAGKAKFEYCAHPDDYELPMPDVLLSQMLMLQANEAEFLRIANRTVLQ